MNFAPEIHLTPEQAAAMARGLYAVAHADGIHESEAALVAGFWEEAGGSEKALADLARHKPITSDELAHALPAVELRRLFIKTALLLAFADGQVSGQESELVREFTAKLGLGGELSALEGQVTDYLLSQLAHIQNTDALAQIAKKLAI
jgi:tellurite resistance protein